jgi:hypothetical protein
MKTTLAQLTTVLLLAGSAIAQSPVPANTNPNPDAPQTPGGAPTFTAPGEKQKFPGPRGTTITFPTGLYDETADGMAQVKAAIEKAKKHNKRVLVMFGENNCGFCVFLNDVIINDPTVKTIVKSDYEFVKVFIGKSFTDNGAVQAKYNMNMLAPTPDGRGLGAPALGVIDPFTDTGLGLLGGNAMVAVPMNIERTFDETKIAQFLTDKKPPAKPAAPVWTAALDEAKQGGKNVLAFFRMPLNEDVERLESWLESPIPASILGRHYVIAWIDTERMIGGTDVLANVSGDKAALAPYLTITDAQGKMIASDTKFTKLAKTDEQIKMMVDALAKGAPKMSDGEKKQLTESLKAAWDPKK